MKQVIRRTAPLGVVIILALIVILEAGVVIGGYIYYQKLAEIVQNNQFVDSLPSSPVQKPLFLSVDGFNNPLTSIDNEVVVSGKTLPNTSVIAYSDVDEFALESDSEGNFQDSLILSGTGGLVRVSAYGDNGEVKTQTFNITESETTVLGRSVSKEIEGKNKTNKLTETSSNTKLEKVPTPKTPALVAPSSQQDSDKITPTPLARSKKTTDFLNDKTESKKTEKLGATRIVTLLTSENTPNLKLSTKKLEAVEVTQTVTLKRHATSGVITNIDGGVITLVHQTQEERETTIYYNASTQIKIKDNPAPSSDQLVTGMRIAVVGIPSEDGLLASKIMVIPGKAIGVVNKNPITTPSITPTATISISPTASPTISTTPPATLTVSPTSTLTPSISTNPTEALDQ